MTAGSLRWVMRGQRPEYLRKFRRPPPCPAPRAPLPHPAEFALLDRRARGSRGRTPIERGELGGRGGGPAGAGEAGGAGLPGGPGAGEDRGRPVLGPPAEELGYRG